MEKTFDEMSIQEKVLALREGVARARTEAASRPQLSALAHELLPLQEALRVYIDNMPAEGNLRYPKRPRDHGHWEKRATAPQRRMDREVTFAVQHSYLYALLHHLGTFMHCMDSTHDQVHRRTILAYARIVFEAATNLYFLLDNETDHDVLRTRALNIKLADQDEQLTDLRKEESELKTAEVTGNATPSPERGLEDVQKEISALKAEQDGLVKLALACEMHQIITSKGKKLLKFRPRIDKPDLVNVMCCLPSLGAEGINQWRFLSASVHVLERPLSRFTMGLEFIEQDVQRETYTFIHLAPIVEAVIDAVVCVVERRPVEGAQISSSQVQRIRQLVREGANM